MHKTRKAARSFRADGLAILTRWPTLVAFLLIAAFSGAGFHSANSMLQQYRQLFDSEGGDNTLQIANREQPRLAVVTAVSEKQQSTWQGMADGILPSSVALNHPLDAWLGAIAPRQQQLSQFTALASARGPPRLS
ncbi:hypothetical protein J2T09_001419 [Neorhizobium huautlense]|uniref:Uncharacterized protein n=1 Tax=Neorhizobium huautlense TaxID=67774 RepID=A0ABT9PS22_9HYPH|nr:hypothetical protein [Neorhizobium huautlense]MDP9836674.1 hypothetical protein [Neorhizobium huautlense]